MFISEACIQGQPAIFVVPVSDTSSRGHNQIAGARLVHRNSAGPLSFESGAPLSASMDVNESNAGQGSKLPDLNR